MHSPDLGYVPREVGLLGDLLELCWSSFRKLFYRRSFFSILSFIPVLCLLCRIHGLSRPIQIPVFDLYLRYHVHHTLDCILRVRFSRLQFS